MREHTPHRARVSFVNHHRANRFAATRQLSEPGNIKIAEPSHGGGARNRRCGHHQQMRRGTVIGFGIETFALFHTESVLLINDHQSQMWCLERLGERRMRSHDNARLATGRSSKSLTPGCEFHAAR